jgi:hypothetical protein
MHIPGMTKTTMITVIEKVINKQTYIKNTNIPGPASLCHTPS